MIKLSVYPIFEALGRFSNLFREIDSNPVQYSEDPMDVIFTEEPILSKNSYLHHKIEEMSGGEEYIDLRKIFSGYPDNDNLLGKREFTFMANQALNMIRQKSFFKITKENEAFEAMNLALQFYNPGNSNGKQSNKVNGKGKNLDGEYW
ncbi:MAG: hypothetical protein KKB03_01965 [Nanoarchaeota archaeon]|nr:hypothetical protein [Nanoarchaeota archaeon]